MKPQSVIFVLHGCHQLLLIITEISVYPPLSVGVVCLDATVSLTVKGDLTLCDITVREPLH